MNLLALPRPCRQSLEPVKAPVDDCIRPQAHTPSAFNFQVFHLSLLPSSLSSGGPGWFQVSRLQLGPPPRVFGRAGPSRQLAPCRTPPVAALLARHENLAESGSRPPAVRPYPYSGRFKVTRLLPGAVVRHEDFRNLVVQESVEWHTCAISHAPHAASRRHPLVWLN